MKPENPKSYAFPEAVKKYAIMLSEAEKNMGCRLENARAAYLGFVRYLEKLDRFRDAASFVIWLLERGSNQQQAPGGTKLTL